MLPRIVVRLDEWTSFVKKLGSRKTANALGNAGHRVCLKVQNNLRNESSRRGWNSITKSIDTKRKGNISEVKMIKKGIYLDSMKPHYVALKRGRLVTGWTKAHLPLKHRTGKSRIYKTKQGGIKPYSQLWVTPHPWISRPITMGLKNANRIVNEELNKVLKGV